MDDVEAAGAEPEVERGDVDDDLVAHAHLPEQRRVGPGRAALAVDLDGERRDGDEDAAAQLQAAAHASPVTASSPAATAVTIPSQTSSIFSRLAAGTRSSGGVHRVGPVGEQDAVEAVEAENVGVAATADRRPHRLDPGAAQCRLRQPQRRRGRGNLVAAEQLFEADVDVAAVLAGAPGAGVRHLPRNLGGPSRVEAARLGLQPAVAGDDVARGAAFDQADVGGRPLVEPSQLHATDRRRRGGDRAAAVLGPDPGVSLDPEEVGEDLLLGRRRDDHLADRRRVVEDEAGLRAQRRGVERFRPAQPLLLGDRQHQLDPDRRRLGGVPRHQLHEDRDRRLVVGAEDRLAAAAEDAFVLDHLDLSPVRDGVEVGAEHHPVLRAPGQPSEQIPRARLGRAGGVVLAHLEPERPQLGRDGVGDLALLPGRAADLAEPDESVVAGVRCSRRTG